MDKATMKFDRGNLTEIRLPNRLLNENVLNGTILMILITCTVASFVAQKSAYKLALSEEEDDIEEDVDEQFMKTHERILIPMKNLNLVDDLIELAVSIKSKKNKIGLYALNVIDKESVSSEAKAKKIVERAAVVASSTDNILNSLMRYDINILNGISGSVKEQKITDIILGQTESLGSSVDLYGPLTDGVLNKCNTTTFIYKSIQSIATIKRYHVIIPERAEREIGFALWFLKIWNLGNNTNAKFVFYGSETTLHLLKEIHDKHPVPATFILFTDWENIMDLSNEILKDDALIIVMSRKVNLSYNQMMSNIPSLMNTNFENNNVLLIYPLQTGIESNKVGLKNSVTTEGLTENLEILDEVRIKIAKLFKKK